MLEVFFSTFISSRKCASYSIDFQAYSWDICVPFTCDIHISLYRKIPTLIAVVECYSTLYICTCLFTWNTALCAFHYKWASIYCNCLIWKNKRYITPLLLTPNGSHLEHCQLYECVVVVWNYFGTELVVWIWIWIFTRVLRREIRFVGSDVE